MAFFFSFHGLPSRCIIFLDGCSPCRARLQAYDLFRMFLQIHAHFWDMLSDFFLRSCYRSFRFVVKMQILEEQQRVSNAWVIHSAFPRQDGVIPIV